MVKNIVMIMMLILNIISFSEVPHTYIYDNPEKAITTAETLKKKPNGAEMNISVIKIKSEEIEGYINNGKIYIPLNEELKNNNIVITTRNKDNRIKKSLKTNTVDFKKENGKLIVDYIKKELYINIFDKNNDLKKIYKVKNTNFSSTILQGLNIFEINEKYTGTLFAMTMNGTLLDNSPNLKLIKGFPMSELYEGMDSGVSLLLLKVNGIQIPIKNEYTYPKTKIKINEELEISISNIERNRKSFMGISFIKFPKKDFSFEILKTVDSWKIGGSLDEPHIISHISSINHTYNFKYKLSTLIGNSNLDFNENYNKSFVNFNADTNGNSLSIENSVPGLNFSTSGKGISILQQGDILEVNGSRVTIGASGNLGEIQGSIGTLGYKYKVENGKLRLALTNWGVLELSRTFEVKVLKGGAEAVRHTFTIQAPKKVEGTSRVKFVETYPNTQFVAFNGVSLNSPTALSLENSITGVILESSTGAGLVTMQQGDILEINGVQNQIGALGTLGEKNISLGSLTLNYMVESGKLRIRPFSWGVQEPQREATVRIIRGTNEISKQVISIQAPKKIEGNSRLTLREYYSINDYIAFNGVSLDNPLSLALENNLRDVTLESSTGAGIVTMLQGDILEINGVQNPIGVSGNLGEKETTIDTLRFAYKVEAGKLRVKVLDWGVLEPRRDIRIKIKRGTNEISIHTLNIKAPIKVQGDSTLKYDNTYQIRTFAKFKGLDLSMPLPITLENIQGVTLESTNGAGIPYMNQGDKIYISDNFRARRSKRAIGETYYEIGASGTLPKQNVKVTNGEIGVQVEGGKLNLALNNWIVNKNINVQVRIVRGTNEIMNHVFTLKVPDAPFNVISQGILDFGTIIAGTKNKKAETDIKIEMIKDITGVQFKLNTDSPELYNKNGVTLRAKNLQSIVRKQGNRTYLVKIQGKLDVPQNQELGEYSGTAILEMKVK